ncbi:MAG TPA: sulfite exporter TauE/SafE family protein [Burkholderiales bacterium]|nr:sulfite exporter TauE/SafE family protein [Burkholderiales bacterium]
MEWLAAYLALGALVGILAGMLGIGGGMIVVPPLALMLESQGLPREHVLHLAVGTGMATILFTSLSSVSAHAARGGVRWEIARRITPGILFGGVAGAIVAHYLSTRTLAIYFTAFVFLMAVNMALDLKPKPSREPPGAAGMFAAGTAIGGLSSLVAIGGAVMSVPFMLYCNVPIRQAVGTAAAIGFPIAVGGTIGYLYTGWSADGLPSWSLGYVYLPALAGITVASVLTAPLGARVAHRVPGRLLKRIFAALLFVFAARMLTSLW